MATDTPPPLSTLSRRGVLFVAMPAAGLFAAQLLRSGQANAQLANASWSFFAPGSRTPAPVFADPELKVRHPNPVKANRAGEFPALFLDSDKAYRAVLTAESGAVLRDIEQVQLPAPGPHDVLYHGADPSGRTSSQAAFEAARAATGGRYHIPSGTYLLDDVADAAGPAGNLWADIFSSDPGVTLTVGAKRYDMSNCLMGAAFQVVPLSPRYRIIRNARTGKDIFRLSERDRETGDAHTSYYPWNIIFDGHVEIYEPRTAGGTVDQLFRKAFVDADRNRNDFSIAYEAAGERWSLNFATTASGAPRFDGAIHLYGGGAAGGARLEFPAVSPRFSQGFRLTTRADGNFRLDAVPLTDRVDYVDPDTRAVHMSFGRAGGLGFRGAAPGPRPAVTGSLSDGSALRSLLAALEAQGLIRDSTR